MPSLRAWHVAFALALVLPTSRAAAGDLKDLYFGEALYDAYQEHYFDALQRLDTEIAQHYRVDEPQLDSLQYYIKNAEFSVGDFELRYRMHQRAGRAIRAVLDADVDEAVRNDAAYRLARLDFQEDQPEDALNALGRIHGRLPARIRDDVPFLRANVYMALRRPADAVDVLERLQGSKDLVGFSQYNLGIALLQDGHAEQAVHALDEAGRVKGNDPATLAIRDKANLLLGTLLGESSQFDPAERALDRVRLTGPYSNQALLRAGWAAASAGNFERALVPWGILAKRNPTDGAVQEALLDLPYAYSKLSVNGRAAVLYGRAVESYGNELKKLDASIKSIQEGRFLAALVREEIRQDKDWVIHLRRLPDAPETFYLMTLMASYHFQTALQNYLDLQDMRKRLHAWQRSLVAFEDLIRLRRRYYEPLLPGIDRRFRSLDARMRLRLEQRKSMNRRLQHLLVAPRPDLLATAEEQMAAARLDRLEDALAHAAPSDAKGIRLRIHRLRGVLIWSEETRYDQRLTDAHEHLRELNSAVDRMKKQYEAFVRTRQAATHSYVGYDVPIKNMEARITDALGRLDVLQTQQGQVLQNVAIAELVGRRSRLEAYQNQARFAFAHSYDQAAKAQAQ